MGCSGLGMSLKLVAFAELIELAAALGETVIDTGARVAAEF